LPSRVGSGRRFSGPVLKSFSLKNYTGESGSNISSQEIRERSSVATDRSTAAGSWRWLNIHASIPIYSVERDGWGWERGALYGLTPFFCSELRPCHRLWVRQRAHFEPRELFLSRMPCSFQNRAPRSLFFSLSLTHHPSGL